MALHALLNFPQEVGCGHIERVAQLEQQPYAGAVAAQLDQRNVVAVHIRSQCQVGLTPLASGSQAAKGLSEGVIGFQMACSIS